MTAAPAGAREIAAAVAALRAGRLVAFPSETVYGLGADASNPDAVRRIFEAKGRPADHPVIVHVASAKQLGDWARDIPASAFALAAAFWPGPMTLVLRRRPHVSDLVTGGQDTVGIRVPSHPVAHALLRAFGGGIAGPSANRFGRISPTTADHVREELGDRIDLVLEGGESEVGIESTIIDLSGATPALLRPGMLDIARAEALLGMALEAPGTASPRASGMLASHYAPHTPTRQVAPHALAAEAAGASARVAVLARRPRPAELAVARWIEAAVDAGGYAHDLYAHLRTLDREGVDLILVEAVPESSDWAAIRDRLGRAATPPERP
jgi:L-threonylcarbamoyladenylate synthase